MKYNLSLARDISRLCATALGYIMLFITVLSIYQKSIPTPYCFWGIALILIGCQVIQHYCFQPVVYILLHGLLWVPVVLIPFSHVEYRYLLLFVLLCESVKAIHVWKINVPTLYEDVPWFLLTCTCILYAVACGYKMDTYALVIYYIGVGVLLLHFIQLFITGLTKLVTKSTQATSMPVKKIMLTSIFIFIFFAIILILLSILVQHSGVDTAFAALGQMLVKALRFLIRTIAYVVTLISALFARDRETDDTLEAQQEVDEALTQLQEPSLLAQILDGCLKIAAIFVMIYLVYRMIAALIRIFGKRYAQDADIVEELPKPKEVTKLPKKKESILKRLQAFFRNDNASKIRRAYRLKITSYKPTVFKKQDTPKEIAVRIYDTYQEDIDELTTVYEKARYSNEEITFDDVQKGGLL